MRCEWVASVSDSARNFSSQTKRNADHSRHGRRRFHLRFRHFDIKHLPLDTAIAWTRKRNSDDVVLFFEKASIDFVSESLIIIQCKILQRYPQKLYKSNKHYKNQSNKSTAFRNGFVLGTVWPFHRFLLPILVSNWQRLWTLCWAVIDYLPSRDRFSTEISRDDTLEMSWFVYDRYQTGCFFNARSFGVIWFLTCSLERELGSSPICSSPRTVHSAA